MQGGKDICGGSQQQGQSQKAQTGLRGGWMPAMLWLEVWILQYHHPFCFPYGCFPTFCSKKGPPGPWEEPLGPSRSMQWEGCCQAALPFLPPPSLSQQLAG